MASSIINSDDGVISGTSGLKTTGGDDGVLNIQNNGTTAVTVNASGNVGVGTTSPGSRVSVGGATVNSANYITFGKRVTSAQSNLPLIGHTSHDGTASDLGICATSSGGNIIFYTGNDASGFGTGSNTEKLRILAGGGITFNGDTAAANALDDYEEGTWTATITTTGTDFTTTGRATGGTYTKIGNLVTAIFDISINSPTSGTGNLIVTGLPFAVSGTALSSHIRWGRVDLVGTFVPFGVSFDTETIINFIYCVNNGNPSSVTAADLNGNTTPYFSGSITYRVT